MINLGTLISKNADDFSLKVTAEWENIVNSVMVLRDDDGKIIPLRRDEMIKGVDY